MSTIRLLTEVPGPKSREMAARREAATPRGASKVSAITIERADGAVLTDADGNTLLDFAGGIGVLAVGHCPPNVVAAIKDQADKLIHFCAIMGTYEPYVQVAEMLNAVTPGNFPKKTILLNSGAEALETAVKVARSYTNRSAIIVFEGAYHGRTNLTLSMTSKYGLFKKGFGPFAPEIYRLPFPNLYRRPDGLSEEAFVDDAIKRLENAFIAQVDPSAVAAIVIETVQGEGGFIPTPPRFLQRIRELCDEHGIVMVSDEVQCGFGRTGRMFAVEHYGIVPDLICMAKSLAAGMPLAAVTGRAEIMDAPHPGGLGGTYSGNPLACVAAIEAIKMINAPDFLEHANHVGVRLRERLLRMQAELPIIGDVRGLGPMLLIEFVKDRATKEPATAETPLIVNEVLKRGVVTIRAGLYSNCLRFLPPLNITDDQLDEGLNAIADAIRAVVSQPVA
ncbi:MAG: 4-aminobutyrate--2-oxoglutarate transaminase [Chloroflexi bacterium]|uniref:4-aminobutyrate--2-oxoglutarate transaminase n=1 Tax=Candidatus Flexifilum breve TaxID=3140694 RepID=UPI003136A850|nr:4-aminobutyrate--2-oxoglutarate transaminase [Chloroflexota bacterium]